METDWAAEHLQTIRTLMERSAVYRRALAPIMVWNGIVGLVGGVSGGVAGNVRGLSSRAFIIFWSGAALLAILGSFLLVRRQALKDSEPFWSPPTRRIAQALLPPLFIGGFLNATVAYMFPHDPGVAAFLVAFWMWLYGCAAHAAGFFMVRGMKAFGWLFIVAGCGLFTMLLNLDWPFNSVTSSFIMGIVFGGLHLVYGVYLYLTEKGKNAA